jgi:hypothetical protein
MIETDVVTGQKFVRQTNPSPEPEVLNEVVSEVVIKICIRLPGDLPDCSLSKTKEAQSHDTMRRNIQIPHFKTVSGGAAGRVKGRLVGVVEIGRFCQEVVGTHIEHKQSASDSGVLEGISSQQSPN